MISFLKKNIFILATIFLLQACGLIAQSQVDSLLSVLGNTRSDSIKVQCYLGLSKSFLAKNMADSSMVYAQKGIELANAIGIQPNFRFYRYFEREIYLFLSSLSEDGPGNSWKCTQYQNHRVTG